MLPYNPEIMPVVEQIFTALPTITDNSFTICLGVIMAFMFPQRCREHSVVFLFTNKGAFKMSFEASEHEKIKLHQRFTDKR